MTLAPEALAGAVRGGDPAAVRRLLAGAGEAERKACLPAVEAVRRELGRVEPPRAWAAALAGRDVPGALLLARVGVLGGAAAVAGVLTRDDGELRRLRDDVAAVLLDRAPRWLPGLVERLADRDTEWATHHRWDLVETLRAAAGLPRPTGAPYLRETAGRLTWQLRRHGDPLPDLDAALRGDPSLLAVVPDLLRVADIGEMLRLRDTGLERGSDTGRFEAVPRPPGETWAGVLAGLAADGLLDRAALLDLVLGVLLLDGKREHHSWFVGLLAALAPAADEVAARVRAYVAVLADGRGNAAAAAQKALRALDDAGRLELETLLDASRAALARAEKGVAVAQLGWLERAARLRPATAGELASAAGDALGHERRDVQERALTALERIARVSPLPGEVLDGLRERALDLPDLLHARAAEVLGPLPAAAAGDDGRPDREPAPAALLPAAPGAAEPRLRTVAEVAEVAAAYLESGDLLAAERVADGLAALAAPDRDALANALAPLAGRLRPGSDDAGRLDAVPYSPLEAALGVLLTRPAVPPPGLVRRLLRRRDDGGLRWPDVPGPEGALAARLGEVVRQVSAGQAQRLLALPAARTGATDPDEVVAGVERAAADGRVPWPLDLEQAWLRLPRPPYDGDDPRLLDRLAACPGPAAAWLRARLVAGPAPDPHVEVTLLPRTVRRWGRDLDTPLAGAPVAALGSSPWAAPAGASLVERVLRQPDLPARAVTEWWEGRRDEPLAVLLALPSHREVAAAHLVAVLVDPERRPGARWAGECLALLPEAGGPTGPATALALGYAAASTDPAVRTAGVDALDGFALRGGLDAAAAGAVLGTLLLRDAVKVGRVAGVLGEVARGPRPARLLVWELLAAALPPVLPTGRRGVAELVTVAADAAAAVGVRRPLPGLDAVADAAGSGRLVTEARRLRSVLAA